MTVGLVSNLGAVEGAQRYGSFMRLITLLGQFDIDVLRTE